MKLFELYQAPARNSKLSYTGTDTRKGYPLGTRKEWLKSMGDPTQEDLDNAYAQVIKSSEYKAIIAMGIEHKSSALEKKNCTLNFEAMMAERWPTLNGREYKKRIRYKVLANGKIDTVEPNDSNRGPRNSPKPHIVPGKPVDSVVKTMKASLAYLHSMLSKRIAKAKKDAPESNKHLST